MSMVSYARNFEDVLLNRVFSGITDGFYVDIGAGHPSEDSVTKTFYDRGWSGINIEPADIFAELCPARPRDVNLRMAVYDRAGEVTFAQHPGCDAALSHVRKDGSGGIAARPGQPDVEWRRVACDTLAGILQTHAHGRPIDFLKIDAAGSESAITRSTDWRAIRPTVLVIAAPPPPDNAAEDADWEQVLLQHGYIRAYFDGINCFYLPEERPDLLRHFAVPVNALDGFVRPEAATALARLKREHDETLAALSLRLDEALRRPPLRSDDSVRLDRLIHDLRWPDGPGAVRAVLPLARLLRRLNGGRATAAAPAIAAPPPIEAPARAPPRRSRARRLALLAYRPLRPLIRPLLWRGRSFLTGDIREELARQNQALQSLLMQSGATSAAAMLATPSSLRAPPGPPGDAAGLQAELRQFGVMLETTLLTLALERDPP